MSLVKNDYSLLRPFDLEAAKLGEAICWYDQETWTLKYIGPATSSCVGCFEWVSGPHTGTFETYRYLDIRMAPLAWVRVSADDPTLQPVYRGDVLYDHVLGKRIAVGLDDTHLRLVIKEGEPWGLFRPDRLTWTQPKVKREGWLNIYPVLAPLSEIVANTSYVHPSKDAADRRALHGRVTCVPIEWEEDAK